MSLKFINKYLEQRITILISHKSVIPINQKRGFTLLELLVVISIIGILIALGTVSYSTAQRKSRDSRRRGDMKEIQNAFEQYYSVNNGFYPADCNAILSITPPIFQGDYPKDPKAGQIYPSITPYPSCTSSGYCFCATLEGVGGNSGPDCNFSATTHFCVKNLQ